jgi:DNA polymerase-3 subunit alpha
MPVFNHLHVHSQFSLLDGAASIEALVKKAKKDNMTAMALTDHGNMFGAFKFVAEAEKHGLKSIIGCEFYLVEDRFKKQFTKDVRDVRFHQLLLAKNREGYKNLVKLCSLGYIEGLYGKYPRIDKELLVKHHKGLIATSCCLAAEIPRTILKKGPEEGEKVLKWWLDLFGEDFYIELQRHGIPEQEQVNKVLLAFAVKYGIKIIASNDSHYVDQSDSNAHDILLCINTGEKQSTPTMKDFNEDDGASKGRRFAFFNDQFFFKTTDEMGKLFHDVPQAIDNTNEIVDKVELLKLKQDILLPNYPIPQAFLMHQGPEADKLNQWEYLRHITFEGAAKRYGSVTSEVEERINFELEVVRNMGFAGYFLIVADFIKAGREMEVFVGPGRGSAAGSAVAYCIGITNIDPIKYNLLFERFLNPDRKSMPDIDTDFDDEGRQKVIDYVVDKYGKNQVAQIITYGTMAAKMSIKDVARVLDLPLPDSNALAKLVPDRPGTNLNWILTGPLTKSERKDEKEKILSEELVDEDLQNAKRLREILQKQPNSAEGKVLKEAMILEGSVRGSGIHAAGIIIAPSDLTDIIPVAVAKDSDLLVTQFDGSVIESAGVIKMDFLGLKTLTIIRDALKMIKENHGREIDIDLIPLDDVKTFELYQKAETNGTFQFESAGMQKYLRELKPDKFEDLIAMNALYRPGPLEYIPNFIRRKHGKEEISYDLPEMEEFLSDTYGITVYQEQVMLLSQKLADFSKGDADTLRKAMGKKDRKTLDKLKPMFVEQASAKGFAKDRLEKIWTDWEAFASYAFNKSHSTCYAFVAYQTAYLKAHYPSEYMASVLTHNLSNIEKITFFLEETRRMGLNVLGPDINESSVNFAVNKKGDIRFGLGAIKGVGEAAVELIVEERKAKGIFKDIFDLMCRCNLRAANRKTFESLALAGGFDCFEGTHRAQYFHVGERDTGSLIEKAIRFGNAWQAEQDAAQTSLFGGGSSQSVALSAPKIPDCEPWNDIEKLRREKEIIGFYLSGHPLDQFALDMKYFCNVDLGNVMEQQNRDVLFAGLLSTVSIRQTKQGKSFAVFMLEDYTYSKEFFLFGEDYLKFAHYLKAGEFLHIKGKIQQHYRNQEEWELKIQQITLLADLRKRMCKQVQLEIQLTEIPKSALFQLEDALSSHPGSTNVGFKFMEEEMTLPMVARNFKVDPNNQLIDYLEDIPGITVKLLK